MRCIYSAALLTGIENPIKRCLTPGNKFGLFLGKYDPSWFTDLAMFQHPHMLVSYYYSGKIQDYRKRLRVRDDVTLWADSGGYSVATKGAVINPYEVLKWQEANSNIAFSLDKPPTIVTGAGRVWPGKNERVDAATLEKHAEISRQNNIIFRDNRTSDKLLIYNVLHGYDLPTKELWWDYVTRDTQFEGYCVGVRPATDALLAAMSIMFVYNKGVRERLHVLGVSGITVIPMIVWASQYIDKLSFDSSSYGYGSRTRAYVYPDRIRDYTHFGRKFLTKDNPMNKIYCKCPICIHFTDAEYFCKSDITWPGMLLSLHNLWCLKEYVAQLEQALIVEKDQQKFFDIVNKNTGDWADKTMYAINFIESCIKIGFKASYDLYFAEHEFSKTKLKRNRLIV